MMYGARSAVAEKYCSRHHVLFFETKTITLPVFNVASSFRRKSARQSQTIVGSCNG